MNTGEVNAKAFELQTKHCSACGKWINNSFACTSCPINKQKLELLLQEE